MVYNYSIMHIAINPLFLDVNVGYRYFCRYFLPVSANITVLLPSNIKISGLPSTVWLPDSMWTQHEQVGPDKIKLVKKIICPPDPTEGAKMACLEPPLTPHDTQCWLQPNYCDSFGFITTFIIFKIYLIAIFIYFIGIFIYVSFSWSNIDLNGLT